MAVAAAAATNIIKKLFFHRPPPNFQPLLRHRHRLLPSFLIIPINSLSTATTTGIHGNKYKKTKSKQKAAAAANRSKTTESSVKRRTRSEKEFDEANVLRYGDDSCHIPVMLGEVLEVFTSVRLRSFVDCTVGAGGHSSAMIQAHPEMELLVGMDVDPTARKMAQDRIKKILDANSCGSMSDMKARIFLRNFKDIKPVLHEIDENLLTNGVDGILMDLGMSSMQVNNAERGFSVLSNGPLDMRMNPQASLKAEDILNSWPDSEVGRILWEYGEESNWRSLQNKIVKARVSGGLHSTGQLVELIRNSTCRAKAGRQGWIKTATRVFQALRIAVNDELKTLEDSLYACFDCLAPKGRLAVVSFHSLEDRTVKQTFLDIIKTGSGDEVGQEIRSWDSRTIEADKEKEPWIKNMIGGQNGTILTKRPITPSEEEEKLNRRSRSAKLRVIQKN